MPLHGRRCDASRRISRRPGGCVRRRSRVSSDRPSSFSLSYTSRSTAGALEHASLDARRRSSTRERAGPAARFRPLYEPKAQEALFSSLSVTEPPRLRRRNYHHPSPELDHKPRSAQCALVLLLGLFNLGAKSLPLGTVICRNRLPRNELPHLLQRRDIGGGCIVNTSLLMWLHGRQASAPKIT